MPDMQTALTEALKKTADAWAVDDAAHQKIDLKQESTMKVANPLDMRVTSNASRITFNFVRGNPGLTKAQVVDRLAAQGLKVASVSSLLSQMHRAGMLKMANDGGLTTAQEAYTPISVAALRVARALDTAARRPKSPVAEPLPESMHKKVTLISTRTGDVFNPPKADAFDADAMLDKLSLRNARTLYDALDKIFGGTK